MNLTPKDKRKLKSLAHHLKPVIQVGQKGITDSILSAIDKTLQDHELIKIKFVDFKEDRRNITIKIAETTKSELITIIGNTSILFRQNTDPEKRKITY